MAPTGAPAPQPLFELCYEMTDFPGNFSKQPNSCHTHLSGAESARVWLRVCICACHSQMCVSVCDCELRTYNSESWCKCIRGWGTYPRLLASHTCGPMSKFSLHWGWNLNICRSRTSKVPKQGTRSQRGPPKSAPCHLLCVSLTFCLPYMNVFSPRLPSQHTLSSSCPSFLAAEEVTFINGEFMCMTAPKPELCLDHPWRLSVNSCNHQSAKYLPFRAHQPWMRWLGVIYRIKSISSSAHLHWYWYGVISSWLRL